jgi:hypothetical protein
MERKYLYENTGVEETRERAGQIRRAQARQSAWWADVLSGRVRKDWAAMEQSEFFEDWARRSTLNPARPPEGDLVDKR